MAEGTLKKTADREASEAETAVAEEAMEAIGDPDWLPNPEQLEAARRYAGKHGFPGSDRHDGADDPPHVVLATLEWVEENGWPGMTDGVFEDLREYSKNGKSIPPRSPASEIPETDGPSREDIEALPGDQGVATQEELEDPGYSPPAREDLTPEELELAEDVVSRLRTQVTEMPAEQVIDDLVSVVDVHSGFLTPMAWPGEKEETFREAPVVREIGVILCRGCPNIEAHARDVMFLWKNARTWTSRGRVIRSKEKSLSSFDEYLSEGQKCAVIVNYQLFKTMNPLQKVFCVYQALRRLSAEGSVIPPHFEGFADELRLFGGRVFREMVTLRTAAEQAKDREDRLSGFQLSLLEEGVESEE